MFPPLSLPSLLLLLLPSITALALPPHPSSPPAHASPHQQHQSTPPAPPPASAGGAPATEFSPASCDSTCRHAFCSSISLFLESVSCGPRHEPCLSVAAQIDVYDKCLTWPNNHLSRLSPQGEPEAVLDRLEREAADTHAGVREQEAANHEDHENPLERPGKTWVGASYPWLVLGRNGRQSEVEIGMGRYSAWDEREGEEDACGARGGRWWYGRKAVVVVFAGAFLCALAVSTVGAQVVQRVCERRKARHGGGGTGTGVLRALGDRGKGALRTPTRTTTRLAKGRVADLRAGCW